MRFLMALSMKENFALHCFASAFKFFYKTVNDAKQRSKGKLNF